MDETCGTCRWFKAFVPNHGACCINPPTSQCLEEQRTQLGDSAVVVSRKFAGLFPTVHDTEWCGKYEHTPA
jgi:hypothetical protein